MAKPIEHAREPEPSAAPWRTGGRLARKYEYLLFYIFAISSWGLEIAAAVLGSLYGGEDHRFIATISPFLATHWFVDHLQIWNATLTATDRAAFLQTCWMMATAPRHTVADRMAYLNLACRFNRLCAVSYTLSYGFTCLRSSLLPSSEWSHGPSDTDSRTKLPVRRIGSSTCVSGSSISLSA